jgi:signal transduction histidine kinase
MIVGCVVIGRVSGYRPLPSSSEGRFRAPPKRRFRVLLRYDAERAALEYVQLVSRLRLLARQRGFDILIALVALESASEVALKQDDAPTTSLWFAVPASAAIVLPLLGRRWFPFGAPAAVWLLAGLLSFVDGQLVPSTVSASLAGMASAVLLGNLRDEVEARAGLAIVAGSAAIIAYNTPDRAAGELIVVPALFAIGGLAGYALRERAERAEAAEVRAAQAEHERDVASRIAVAEERTRIARELHDIVAHAVSVMVLQVGAVRHRLPDERAPDREALRDVEQAGRTALAEMRRLLGAMRWDRDGVDLAPQPGLDAVQSLLDDVRRAGLPVELHVEGEPRRLPPAIDLSAYRIVQEGLTNALKHAGASRADVTLRYARDEVQIVVRDDGAGASTSDDPGYGLAGVRERVTIYGGEMSAGSENGGGFVLRTRLPIAAGGP